MPEVVNIYCDESCHREKDQHRHMILGALSCPNSSVEQVSRRLKEFKTKHGIFPHRELKFTQVSKSRAQYYADILDYYFDDGDLKFRAVIADKTTLRHADFIQTHEDWYYKMFFTTLKHVLNPEKEHRIYIDYKDTHCNGRAAKLHEVLCNTFYDFPRKIIERVQPVRSHEVLLLQLCDLLTGILSYHARQANTNEAKLMLISRMKQRSGLTLNSNTLYKAEKLNLLCWPKGYLEV